MNNRSAWAQESTIADIAAYVTQGMALDKRAHIVLSVDIILDLDEFFQIKLAGLVKDAAANALVHARFRRHGEYMVIEWEPLRTVPRVLFDPKSMRAPDGS